MALTTPVEPTTLVTPPVGVNNNVKSAIVPAEPPLWIYVLFWSVLTITSPWLVDKANWVDSLPTVNTSVIAIWAAEIWPPALILILVPADKAFTTFDVSVISAPASIAFNFVWSASVNTFESVAASTAVLISASVWSAVAFAATVPNLTLSASVKALVLLWASYKAFISEPVKSSFAFVSTVPNFDYSASVKPLVLELFS